MSRPRYRRALFPAGVLATLAVVGVGISPGSDGRASDVVRYRAVTIEASEVDHGESGPSLGDQLVFSDSLRRGGNPIGYNGGVCTLTTLTRGQYLCVSTARFKGKGTIAGQFFLGSSERVEIAITGGTGQYRGAEGAGVALIRSETVADVTLRLRIP